MFILFFDFEYLIPIDPNHLRREKVRAKHHVKQKLLIFKNKIKNMNSSNTIASARKQNNWVECD